MRIALTNPFSWPDVRRGSERFMNDLARYLVGQGHDVTVIASHPRPDTIYSDDGITHVRTRQRFRRGVGRWLTSMHAFALQTSRVLRQGRFDVIHCLSYYDAYGASLALKPPAQGRLVMQIVGIPVKRYFRTIPHDRFLFVHALRRANATIVPSRCAQRSLKHDFQREATLIPPPVDLKYFSPNGPRPAGSPIFLFVGDADEVRKGAGTLIRAIRLVLRSRRDARFVFSGKVGTERKAALLSLLNEREREAVNFLGVGEQTNLPGLYRQASVTVLPAIWEAFGLVLAESLACGTPVVGCNHGGIGDIVSQPEVGRLFEPGSLRGESDNIEGLARAMLDALELAQDSSTAGRCRRHAERFGWDRLGPAFEELYCV